MNTKKNMPIPYLIAIAFLCILWWALTRTLCGGPPFYVLDPDQCIVYTSIGPLAFSLKNACPISDKSVWSQGRIQEGARPPPSHLGLKIH